MSAISPVRSALDAFVADIKEAYPTADVQIGNFLKEGNHSLDVSCVGRVAVVFLIDGDYHVSDVTPPKDVGYGESADVIFRGATAAAEALDKVKAILQGPII